MHHGLVVWELQAALILDLVVPFSTFGASAMLESREQDLMRSISKAVSSLLILEVL